MTDIHYKILVYTEAQMHALAAKLYYVLKSSAHRRAVIFLHGTLGMGKTTFVRGFLRSVPYSGHVKSPTYTLMEPYNLDGVDIYHLDLYRISEPEALEEIGLRDIIDDDAYFFVEWPLKENNLFEPDLEIHIVSEGDARRVTINATSNIGQDIVQALS